MIFMTSSGTNTASRANRSTFFSPRSNRNAESATNDAIRPLLPEPSAIETEKHHLKHKAYKCYALQYLLRFCMSATSFGLAVAAAAISGGAGIPLAVVTGAAMLVAIGDLCCAWYNWIQIGQQKETLSMDNDCIALAVKSLVQYCGCSVKTAENSGDVISMLFRSGLAVTSTLLPVQLPNVSIADNTALILRRVSADITAVLLSFGGLLDYSTARAERAQRELNRTDIQQQENERVSQDHVVQPEMVTVETQVNEAEFSQFSFLVFVAELGGQSRGSIYPNLSAVGA